MHKSQATVTAISITRIKAYNRLNRQSEENNALIQSHMKDEEDHRLEMISQNQRTFISNSDSLPLHNDPVLLLPVSVLSPDLASSE